MEKAQPAVRKPQCGACARMPHRGVKTGWTEGKTKEAQYTLEGNSQQPWEERRRNKEIPQRLTQEVTCFWKTEDTGKTHLGSPRFLGKLEMKEAAGEDKGKTAVVRINSKPNSFLLSR